MSENVTVKKRGPKPGSKKRSKVEILQAQLAKLLAVAGPSDSVSAEFRNAAAIVQNVLRERAATAKIALTAGVHPRLATLRADRSPLKAARRRFETVQNNLAIWQEKFNQMEPFAANVAAMCDYFDRCETILTDAIKASQDIEAVILPDRPIFADGTSQYATELRQSRKKVANSATPVEDSDDDELSDDELSDDETDEN